MKQVNSDQKIYETNLNQTQNHYDMAMGLPSQVAPLNRLSEQEEEDDDADYDDDIEEGCEDDVMDNVSKNTTSTTSFTCYSSLGNSKLKNAYPCAADATATHSDTLRRRNVGVSVNGATKTKATKSKCVQFMPSTKLNDDPSYPTARLPAKFNKHSKPLKKIVFNGTFPIDDPYSSRF